MKPLLVGKSLLMKGWNFPNRISEKNSRIKVKRELWLLCKNGLLLYLIFKENRKYIFLQECHYEASRIEWGSRLSWQYWCNARDEGS